MARAGLADNQGGASDVYLVSERRAVMRTTIGAAAVGTALALASAGSALAASQASPASHRPGAVRVHQIPVGGNPRAVAVDQTRGIAWAATGVNLIRISEATQRRGAHLRIRASLVRVDPSKAMVVAVNSARGTIVEVSERTNKVIRTFSEEVTIESLALDTKTHTIWFSSGHSVTELNETTGHVLHTVPVASGSPLKFTGALAVDSSRGLIWVCVDGDGRNPPPGLIAEIKESTHRVSKKFGIGSRSCTPAVDPVTGKVWAAIGETSLRIIDEKTGTNKVVTGIPNNADGVAIDHHAKTVVVTSNQPGTNDVHLVSERTKKVTRTIKVGFFPISATVDPVTGNAYIPIAFRGVVTEFHV
jgi:DNA-binding beta-propeller fold protein YncE